MVRHVYGYNRVSTKEQHEERGTTAIHEFCMSRNLEIKEIIVDKVTGKNFDRAGYKRLKNDLLRSGDFLVISELDRLGRRRHLIREELVDLKKMGVYVYVLNIPTTLVEYKENDPIMSAILETVSSMLIEMYSLFAEIELETREKRQKEGTVQKAVGVELGTRSWDFGRPNKVTEEEFIDEYGRYMLHEITKKELLQNLNISRKTCWNYEQKLRNGLPHRNTNHEKWLPENKTE